MRRVFIVHGWSGSPEEPLHKWLKSELEKLNFKVEVPTMPEADEPKIETWVPFINSIVGAVNQETFFIGHSIGCQAIIRYLETLPNDTKIGGAVFIAGWYDVRNLETEEEWKIVGPWVKTSRNDDKIRQIINKAIAIFSDNDPFVAPENQKSWHEKIGAKIVIEHNKGHFTEEDGVISLPSAINSILEISK